jgi:hypothetical protein
MAVVEDVARNARHLFGNAGGETPFRASCTTGSIFFATASSNGGRHE